MDNVWDEKQKNDAQLLPDNEVYEIMIKAMYKKLIVDEIKKQVLEGKNKI